MSNRTRYLLRMAPIVVALGAMIVLSGQYLQGKRDAAAMAANDLAHCRSLAVQVAPEVGRAKGEPAQAMAASDLTRLIEQAAQGAGVLPEALARITPEPAKRLENSTLREEATEVVLQQITLRQLIGFLHAVTSGNSVVGVRSVRLLSPPEEEVGRHWTAEVRVVQLIQAPPTEAGGNR
jgi:hypothetical protein